MLPESTPNMAVYRPQSLEYKLCRVFDAGVSDVDTFSRQCEVSAKVIERLARGDVEVDVQTRQRIHHTLSAYYRNNPELYQDASPASKRGVEEVVLRARDWRGFEVTASTGVCIMYVEWPTKLVTQARIDGLWRYLEREDPQAQLHVI